MTLCERTSEILKDSKEENVPCSQGTETHIETDPFREENEPWRENTEDIKESDLSQSMTTDAATPLRRKDIATERWGERRRHKRRRHKKRRHSSRPTDRRLN